MRKKYFRLHRNDVCSFSTVYNADTAGIALLYISRDIQLGIFCCQNNWPHKRLVFPWSRRNFASINNRGTSQLPLIEKCKIRFRWLQFNDARITSHFCLLQIFSVSKSISVLRNRPGVLFSWLVARATAIAIAHSLLNHVLLFPVRQPVSNFT